MFRQSIPLSHKTHVANRSLQFDKRVVIKESPLLWSRKLFVLWLQNNYFLLFVICHHSLLLCLGSLQFPVPVIFEFKHFAKILLVSIISLSSKISCFLFQRQTIRLIYIIIHRMKYLANTLRSLLVLIMKRYPIILISEFCYGK